MTADAESRIAELIQALHTYRWVRPDSLANPMIWVFNLKEPMNALLEIARAAQEPLSANLSDLEIADQVILMLGGVGDERAVSPIIAAIKRASAGASAERRKTIFWVGNVALTNITVADVIWQTGGGITVARSPDDPASCWAASSKRNEKTFRVRDIKQSRRYSNYPDYGIYRGRP